MALMVLVFAACTTEAEAVPELTITSEQNVVIGLNDSYQLAYTTDEHAQTVTVTVSEKDGGTGGSYDEATQTFTATEGGEYTLTIVATNDNESVTETVTIIVNTALPVLTFSEGKQDAYVVDQGATLTLPEATAKDLLEQDVAVVVHIDSPDALLEANEFSSDVPGEYVVTYTAEDAYGNVKVETIIITVTLTHPPEISYEAGKEDVYEIAVGAVLVLPSATAVDALDQPLELEVSPTQQRGVSFEQNVDGAYDFVAEVAGLHIISYYAEDAFGNFVEEFIEVNVIPTHPETELSPEENQISNLATSGLVYKENFARGYSSDLARGLVWDGLVKLSIEGGENAINGNSLILDYANATATSNTQIFFGALDQYLQSGRWEISFDVEILQGNVPEFYVSFIYEGDVSGDNVAYTITPGEVNRIEYNFIKTFDESNQWFFRIFTFTGDSNFDYDGLKLAIDNIEIRWTEVADASVVRTGTPKTITPEMLDGEGYTLTGTDDNYTNISGNGGARWVTIEDLVAADILTPEQQALLVPENGFNSPYAIRATAQRNHFDSLRGLFTDPDYLYTVTYHVFTPTTDNWFFWIAREDQSEAFATPLSNDQGLKVFTQQFRGNAAFYHTGLYSGGVQDLLIGDITISREPIAASDTTPNGYQVGETWTFDSFLQGQVDASQVDLGEGVMLDSVEGFEGEVMALVDDSTTQDRNVTAINASDIFEMIGTYEVTFTLYVQTLENGPLMVNLDNQVFDALTITETGLVTVTYQVSGRHVNFLSLYTQNETLAEVYLANIQIELVEIEGSLTTPNGHSIGDSWHFDSFLQEQMNASDVDLGEGVMLDSIDGFEGHVMAHIDESTSQDRNVTAINVSNYIELVGTYEITLLLYVVSLENGPLMVNFDNQLFDPLDVTETGVVTVTYQVSGRNANFFSLYTQNATLAEIYLRSITIELIDID